MAAVAFVAGAQIAGGIGVPFTDPGSDWYLNLQKAPFNPPPWVFGPVWGVLYVVIGLAAFIAWLAPPGKNRTLALRWWTVQLLLNASWTPVFFGARLPGWGLALLLGVDVAVAASFVYLLRTDKRAGWMFLPYLMWVLFATSLNAWIVVAN